MKLYKLHYIFFAIVASISVSCDSTDPAFVVAEETPEKKDTLADGDALPDYNRQSGNDAGENKIAQYGESKTEIIKDNGKKPDDGGSVPGEIIDPKTGKIDENMIESKYYAKNGLNDLKDSEMNISTDNLYQETVITMNAAAEQKSNMTDQVTRDPKEDTGPQGYAASEITENFDQQNVGVLDLLIVIDDSGSMGVEQAKVAANLPALLSEIGNSDWRITVVTTYNGRVSGMVSKGDVDANGVNNEEARFEAAIAVGASGRGNEKGIKYAREGLDKTLANGMSWIRPDSTLAILIISDEDNCSYDGGDCGNDAWATTDYLTDYITTIRPVTNPVRVHGIVWHQSVEKADCSTAYNQAKQYSAVITETGGAWGSICADDYSAVLSGISSAIYVDLKSQFSLAHIPNDKPIEVTVTDPAGTVVVVPYTEPNSKTLTFTELPPQGSSIEVKYEYGGSPIYTKFALGTQPATETMAVSYRETDENSVVTTTQKDADTYDIIEENGSYFIQFKQGHTPPDHSTVVMNYKEYKPLVTELAISCAYKLKADAQLVKVYVGNSLLADTQYTADFANKKVLFNKDYIPADGENIKAEFTCYNQVYTYDYQSSANAADLYVYNAASKEQVEIAFNNNKITFAPDLFQEGAKYTVRNLLDVKAALDGSIELSNVPYPLSVSVESGGVVCSGNDLGLDVKKLDVSKCPFDYKDNDYKIKYKYVIKTNLTFSVDKKFFAVPHNKVVWRVSIDGVVTTDYKIEANVINLNPKAVAPTAKEVSIEVTLVNG